MKNLILFCLFTMLFVNCSEDPCDIPNNLECGTADNDQDGVPNGEDTAPENACIPNFPSFEENIVGLWDYRSLLLQAEGRIQMNADGTYEDIENEIVRLDSEILNRKWTVENETLIWEVENESEGASITLPWIDYDCDSVRFKLQLMTSLTRVK